MPDHSWLSPPPLSRLSHEVHQAVFDWVLARIAEAGLIKSEWVGADAWTMEANAALRSIVRLDIPKQTKLGDYNAEDLHNLIWVINNIAKCLSFLSFAGTFIH